MSGGHRRSSRARSARRRAASTRLRLVQRGLPEAYGIAGPPLREPRQVHRRELTDARITPGPGASACNRSAGRRVVAAGCPARSPRKRAPWAGASSSRASSRRKPTPLESAPMRKVSSNRRRCALESIARNECRRSADGIASRGQRRPRIERPLAAISLKFPAPVLRRPRRLPPHSRSPRAARPRAANSPAASAASSPAAMSAMRLENGVPGDSAGDGKVRYAPRGVVPKRVACPTRTHIGVQLRRGRRKFRAGERDRRNRRRTQTRPEQGDFQAAALGPLPTRVFASRNAISSIAPDEPTPTPRDLAAAILQLVNSRVREGGCSSRNESHAHARHQQPRRIASRLNSTAACDR